VFTDAVRRQLAGNPTAVENLWPELAGVPPAFFDYLGRLGLPLLEGRSLDPYLHSIETTAGTGPPRTCWSTSRPASGRSVRRWPSARPPDRRSPPSATGAWAGRGR
jgi:hypothetical protein